MQISLDPNFGKYYIRSYEAGQFMVNDQIIQQSIIVTPDQLITNWPPQIFVELQQEHLQTLIAFQPEVVLLGTGIQQHFFTPEFLTLFYQQHIGIEVMTTAAASRTYNVLISEGRKVVAGLLVR